MSKFCINCGQELDEDVSFCINCGNITKKIHKNENKLKESNNSKNRVIAGFLGIFLGTFGLHNFYLGYTKKGLAQLLITVLSFSKLSYISGIWGLVEGIFILTGYIDKDGEGYPLSD